MNTKRNKEKVIEEIMAQYTPEFGDMICDLFAKNIGKTKIETIVLKEIEKISKEYGEEKNETK